MHTHHSHSGQFCQHAKNTLEEMILQAIKQDLKVMCLTEHMPRIKDEHLYPEEIESHTTVESLAATFDSYFKLARKLQAKYADQIEILVGFEGEGISHEYLNLMKRLISEYHPDMFIGSVHHLDDTPLDIDQRLWNEAKDAAGGIEAMYQLYFARLEEVITTLRPPVVAHFDLIRLFSPQFDLRNSGAWPLVEKAVKAGVRENCLFEINSAALRKGWPEPYPRRDIAELIIASGGKFCLSDDSHNIAQVALNYGKVLTYLQGLGVEQIYYLKRVAGETIQVPTELSGFEQWTARKPGDI